MKLNKYLCLTCSAIFLTFSAEAVELCGNLNQGELVIGKLDNVGEVYLNGKKIDTDKDGAFLMAFARDEKEDQLLSIVNQQGETQSFALPIAPTDWNIQNIT